MKDVMSSYHLIVLGQDVPYWLPHLCHHYINNGADFCVRLIAHFQSLFNKLTQPWYLKSIKCKEDDSYCSSLKCFQSMRNRIPNITEVEMSEDFYRGSHDEAFVHAILQRDLATSEKLVHDIDRYITANKRSHDLIDQRKRHVNE